MIFGGIFILYRKYYWYLVIIVFMFLLGDFNVDVFFDSSKSFKDFLER